MYNIYWIVSLWFRFKLLLLSIINMWKLLHIGALIEQAGCVYIHIDGKIVRLEIYPSLNTNDIRIGDKYYTTDRPIITRCNDSDQD